MRKQAQRWRLRDKAVVMNEYYPYLVNTVVRLPVVVQSDAYCKDIMIVAAPNLVSSYLVSP